MANRVSPLMKDDTAALEMASRLEAAFDHIRKTRMADVPILNDALGVAVVGLQAHALGGQSAYVGALVTPWFINFVAIADDQDADGVTANYAITETVQHTFQSGSYPFLVCEEAALGRFAMCSLFSPVHEFQDHATAVAVAKAAVHELFHGEATGAPTEEEAAVAAMWDGEWVSPQVEPSDQETPVQQPDEPTAPSRRAIITGGLAADAAPADEGQS